MKKIYLCIAVIMLFMLSSVAAFASATPEKILDNALLQLSQSTFLLNKYIVEYDNALTYTVWLYAKKKPNRREAEEVCEILGRELSDVMVGYFFNFYIFPPNSVKKLGDKQTYDTYWEAVYRDGKVIFPTE